MSERTLQCGHSRKRVQDYRDDYRWVIRCTECGCEELWTQTEWKASLVLDESGERPSLQTLMSDLLVSEEPALV